MWLRFHVFGLLLLQILVCYGCPEVVSRDTWDAVSPTAVQYLPRPVSLVVFEHTVSPPCNTDEECESMVNFLQGYHMDKLGYKDIAASFYVGGNGKLYEGVGWLRAGSHTAGYSDMSIGIAFIGNYNDLVPTEAQLEAVKDLLKCGVEQEHLTPDYRVVGHRQLIATESPGRKLYKVIRKWPQWLENVSSLKNTTAPATE